MNNARFWAGAMLAVGIMAGIAFPGHAAAPVAHGAATRAAAVPSTAAIELYNQIVDQYLAAKWDTLGADLAKTKDIAAMSKEQQADVTYIKQAVADGRPAWWNQIKQGRKMQFAARLWQRSVTAVWDPSKDPGYLQAQQSGGQTTFTVSWGAADMDSTVQAEHGFTKGDLAYLAIWGGLEQAELFASLSLQRMNALDQPQKIKLNRFMGLRATLTGAYFGTPRTRRWAGFLSFDAYFGDHVTSDGFIPRKPFGAMLVQEIVSHPATYPSLRVPAMNELVNSARGGGGGRGRSSMNATPLTETDNVEGSLATNFMNQFQRATLSVSEDKALREAIKEFALANGTTIFEGGKVILPNKLAMPLNPDDDKETATARNKWLLEELASPGIHAAATKPTTKPARGTTRQPN